MKNDDYQRVLRIGLKKSPSNVAPLLDAYVPDRQKITQYPLEVLPDGSVLSLYGNPGSHEVNVDGWHPNDALSISRVGQRSVLA
jgi:hypothetical protein